MRVYGSLALVTETIGVADAGDAARPIRARLAFRSKADIYWRGAFSADAFNIVRAAFVHDSQTLTHPIATRRDLAFCRGIELIDVRRIRLIIRNVRARSDGSRHCAALTFPGARGIATNAVCKESGLTIRSGARCRATAEFYGTRTRRAVHFAFVEIKFVHATGAHPLFVTGSRLAHWAVGAHVTDILVCRCPSAVWLACKGAAFCRNWWILLINPYARRTRITCRLHAIAGHIGHRHIVIVRH
jgi:hypothetical protein